MAAPAAHPQQRQLAFPSLHAQHQARALAAPCKRRQRILSLPARLTRRWRHPSSWPAAAGPGQSLRPPHARCRRYWPLPGAPAGVWAGGRPGLAVNRMSIGVPGARCHAPGAPLSATDSTSEAGAWRTISGVMSVPIQQPTPAWRPRAAALSPEPHPRSATRPGAGGDCTV